MNASDLKARYNAGGNAIIPNAFQCPNYYIDTLMAYLTPEENVVLIFAIRRILGFQDNIFSRKDKISLSQFTDGIKSTKDGSMLCRGCGLGIQSVRNALENLEKYKILIPTTEKPDPVNGQEYWLQSEQGVIDIEGLEQRQAEKKQISYKRTQKATEASKKKRGVTCDVSVTSHDRGNVGRKAPITSDVIEGVTSDVNTKLTETHGNPLLSAEMQKIISEANASFDKELELMRLSAGKSWTKLPEAYHAYGKAFCAATGLEYVKKNLYDWMGTFEEWNAQRYMPQDVIAAVQAITDEGRAGTISAPRSITHKLNGIKVARITRERALQAKATPEENGEPDWREAWALEQANRENVNA